MPRIDIRFDDTVLGVGCDVGGTALAIGGRVWPCGRVLGIDCGDAFLGDARARAEKQCAPNVRFASCDAEPDLGESDYDFVFSSFGTMFFANPVADLRSMRRALKPGDLIAHVAWRDRADKPRLIAAPGRGAPVPAAAGPRRLELRSRPASRWPTERSRGRRWRRPVWPRSPWNG